MGVTHHRHRLVYKPWCFRHLKAKSGGKRVRAVFVGETFAWGASRL